MYIENLLVDATRERFPAKFYMFITGSKVNFIPEVDTLIKL